MTMKSSARIAGALVASAIVVTGTLLPLPDAVAPALASPSTAAPAEDALPTLTYDDVAEWAELLVNGEDVERDAAAPDSSVGGSGAGMGHAVVARARRRRPRRDARPS